MREGYIFDGYAGSAMLLEAQIRAGLVFPVTMQAWLDRHPPMPVPAKPKKGLMREPVPSVIAPPARKRGAIVLEHVAKRSGFSAAEILGGGRSASLVAARCRVSRIMRRLGCSYCEIGRALERNHSTVIYYLGAAHG